MRPRGRISIGSTRKCQGFARRFFVSVRYQLGFGRVLARFRAPFVSRNRPFRPLAREDRARATRTTPRRCACRATRRRAQAKWKPPERAATQISRFGVWRLTITLVPSGQSMVRMPASRSTSSASRASTAASMRASTSSTARWNSLLVHNPGMIRAARCSPPLAVAARAGARRMRAEGPAQAARAAREARARHAMKPLATVAGELRLEGVALAEVARALRHPLLRLFARRDRGGVPRVRRGPRGRRPPRLLRGEGELQPRDARRAARAWARASTSSPAASSRACCAAGGARRRASSSPASASPRPRSAPRWPPASAASTWRASPSSSASTRWPRALGIVAPVSLRVNPDVDAKTHPYISTGPGRQQVRHPARPRARGLPPRRAACANLRVTGIDCHIGSQILEAAPLDEAVDRVLELVARGARREGIALEHVDLGGGFGIRYRDETPPDVRAYCAALAQRLAGSGLQVLLEPGRAHRRQRGRAAHPRRVPEARQGEALRRRRRLDERADPPRALRGVARHRAGRRRAPGASRAPTTSWARCANPRTSSAPTASSPSRRATCSPSSRPAPTRWRWRRTTTRARAPPKCWSTAARARDPRARERRVALRRRAHARSRDGAMIGVARDAKRPESAQIVTLDSASRIQIRHRCARANSRSVRSRIRLTNFVRCNPDAW